MSQQHCTDATFHRPQYHYVSLSERDGIIVPHRDIPASNTCHIPSSVSQHIQAAIVEIDESPYIESEFERFLKQATIVFDQFMPIEIKSKIKELQHPPLSFLEVTGLPQDPILPNTPERGELVPKIKKTFVTEACGLWVSSVLGTAFNFRQEGRGTGPLIDNVIPLAYKAEQKGGGGFKNNFPPHTESAWHHLSPEYLLLKGVRQDHNKEAQTLVASIDNIITNLSQEDEQILRKDIFELGAPDLYKEMEQQGIPLGVPSKTRTAIIEGQLDNEKNPLSIRINFNDVSSSSNKPLKSLCRLEREVFNQMYPIYLRDDNLVIINNKRALHTRNGYTPRFDGQDRWFQRFNVQLTDKLWESRKVPSTAFSGTLSISDSSSKQIWQTLQANGFINTYGCLTEHFSESEKHSRYTLIDRRENVKKSPDMFSQRISEPDFLKLIPDLSINQQYQVFSQLLYYNPVFPSRIV